MKKILSFLVALCIVFSLGFSAVHANAQEPVDIIYLEDGSYIITELQVIETRATNVKSSTHTKNCYNTDGSLAWEIKLTATFTYDGVTARCTATDLDVTIYDSSWYKISAYHSREAAQGYANVQLGHKLLGVTVEKPTYYLSLNCTPDGNIS